jgi:hypothetical protein
LIWVSFYVFLATCAYIVLRRFFLHEIVAFFWSYFMSLVGTFESYVGIDGGVQNEELSIDSLNKIMGETPEMVAKGRI